MEIGQLHTAVAVLLPTRTKNLDFLCMSPAKRTKEQKTKGIELKTANCGHVVEPVTTASVLGLSE